MHQYSDAEEGDGYLFPFHDDALVSPHDDHSEIALPHPVPQSIRLPHSLPPPRLARPTPI